MNNDKLTIIMPSGINAELAPPPSRPSLRKRFKCLLSSLAMLAIGQVYADYTLTYQYNEPVVIKEFDRYGGEFDYTFEKKTYTAPTYSTYGGTLKTEYSFSRTTPPSWVKISRVDGVIYGTRTLNGVPSNYTFPKDGFSLEPHIIATVEENTTSAERVCIVTNTLSAKSYPSYIGMGSQTSTSYFHWYCVFKQAPGSSTVTVTLEANDGTPVQPYSNYEYVNGGRNFGFDNGGTYTVINTGYKQTKMQPPYGAVVSDEWRRYADSFIMPTTSRAGCVFDGWWTVSIFPEANNVRISNADNTPIDGVKPTAKVTTIKAHWLFEAPHNFMATRNLTDMILLSWEPVVETSETTYNIYRSQSENCPATPTFTTSATSYNDTSAVAGQEYNYWIVAERPNYYSVSHSLTNTVSGYREMQQIATPTISPTDGAIFFGSSETVSLECATQGASIYYTTDGTTPDANSTLYVSPFSILATATIKAVAIKNGMKTSGIATATITKQLPLSLSDALDTDMTLSAYGSAEWIGVRDSAAKVGAGYAKNGVLGNRQSTSLSVIVSGKGAFSFWWRVSCEGYGEYDCDLATFSAPDSNVQELKRDGIMPEWEKITASFSTDGEHTLTWTYKKDKSDADGDDCLYLDGFSWTPAAPDPIIWTITFNLNGADAQDGTSPRSINDAAAIGELPTPTRAGYTFAGWWTEAEGGMEVTATTTVAADMTLFAHWTENLPPAPAYTSTTPVPVRHDWLAKYSGILSAAGNDYEAAAMRQTGKKDGKGNALCVWHDYLAGTDPTNANSVFRAKVEFENGRPKVGWEPDLNEKGAKTERFYKVFGKKTLASNENWTRLADETAQKDYNFFKVTVNMEETPDAEEELKFGVGNGTGGSDVSDGDNRPVLFSAPYDVSARGMQGCVSIGWRSDISYSSDSSKWVDFCIYKADVNDISKAVKIKTLSEHATYIPNSCEDVVDDFDTHYYWVRIETKTARSEYSECASAAAILTGPKNLTATANRTDGVLLTWDALPFADSYKVFADDDNGYNFTREIGDAAGTSIFDSAAPAGKIIRYKVLTMSQNANEYSYSWINGARYGGEILAPVVSGSGNTEDIGIFWQPVVGAISYDIYRNTAKNTSSAIKIDTVRPQGLNGIGYRDTTVDIGKIYYYWVKTVYESGESGFSNVFSGARFAPHPTNVKATTLRSDGILLTWDPVVGATSYRIYGSGDTLIKETTDCRWIDTTVAQGSSRMYKRVTSVCAAGEYELGGEVYLSGYRTTTDSISSVAMTGKSELELANGNKLSLLCTATMASGEKLTVYPEAWDFSDLPEGYYTCERPNEYLYLTIDKRCFAGEGEKTITIRATWTSTERDCDPTVYNLSHKVVVHPAE